MGIIIVIEGIDKSGKTTQARMLKEELSKQFKVELFSFPDYTTLIGREIKAILKERRKYNARVVYLLFSANRWENKERLEMMSKENEILILNRYYQSNIVYGLAEGLPLEWLETLDKGLPKEDLTIVIDISVETMINRTNKLDLFEGDIEKMKRVRTIYKELTSRYGWVIINGEKNKEEVHKDILSVLSERFPFIKIG